MIHEGVMDEVDEAAVAAALRRQRDDPDDHDVSLIEECLSLTPEARLRRLVAWVNLVAEARSRPSEPAP